ncbi:hypothetical protein AB4144_19790, partial [Rhizobiaceae sp. 2RAB30]
QSLANYVEENLPDYVALSAGKRQPTEIASGFRYHTNDYLKLPHIPALSTDRVPSDRTRNNDEAKLTPTADQALWVLDIYGLVVGSLLIVFGNIGDRAECDLGRHESDRNAPFRLHSSRNPVPNELRKPKRSPPHVAFTRFEDSKKSGNALTCRKLSGR